MFRFLLSLELLAGFWLWVCGRDLVGGRGRGCVEGMVWVEGRGGAGAVFGVRRRAEWRW